MRLSTTIPALAALVSVLAASDVLDLTKSSFNKEVMSEDLALVEFFAPCESLCLVSGIDGPVCVCC